MEQFQPIILFATILVPIISGLTQAFKKAVPVPKNYVPVISVVIGLAVGFAAAPFTDFDLQMRFWSGGLAGLAATGLFELALNKRPGITKGDK